MSKLNETTSKLRALDEADYRSGVKLFYAALIVDLYLFAMFGIFARVSLATAITPIGVFMAITAGVLFAVSLFLAFVIMVARNTMDESASTNA
jgi:hypothetical protein